MREIKFEYIVIGRCGNVIKEMFPLHDIQRGYAQKWLQVNTVRGEIHKRQYTGLKDTYDVEIYEGDILQCCEDGLKWVARFVNGSFVACNPDDYLDFVMLDDYRFLVIGNKYESPELLEQLR